MELNSKICVIGIGLIGRKIVEQLSKAGYRNVIPCCHSDLELLDQQAVNCYFIEQKPEYVFFCAVKAITDFESGNVGDAEEAYSNIMMQCNIIHAAQACSVKKMVVLGSAMLYPWNIREEYEWLDESQLEEFNMPGYRDSMQAIVLGKLVGLKLCQYYHRQYGSNLIYCLPTHIYGGFAGRRNLYFLERLVMDICDAKTEKKEELYLDVFGEGKAQKQFLHADDCARAIIRVMEAYEGPDVAVNICSDEISCWKSIIDDICQETGYSGNINFSSSRQENMANRLCSSQKLKDLDWRPQISIQEGIKMLCREYIQSKKGKL
jgi:GDP-L-fucose synthase